MIGIDQIIEDKHVISNHETQTVQYPILIYCSKLRYILPQFKVLKTIASELNIVEPYI